MLNSALLKSMNQPIRQVLNVYKFKSLSSSPSPHPHLAQTYPSSGPVLATPSQMQESALPAMLLPGRHDGSVILENEEKLWKGRGKVMGSGTGHGGFVSFARRMSGEDSEEWIDIAT